MCRVTRERSRTLEYARLVERRGLFVGTTESKRGVKESKEKPTKRQADHATSKGSRRRRGEEGRKSGKQRGAAEGAGWGDECR